MKTWKRGPDAEWDVALAKKMYENGTAWKEIAALLGVNLYTLRNYASRHHWSRKKPAARTGEGPGAEPAEEPNAAAREARPETGAPGPETEKDREPPEEPARESGKEEPAAETVEAVPAAGPEEELEAERTPDAGPPAEEDALELVRALERELARKRERSGPIKVDLEPCAGEYVGLRAPDAQAAVELIGCLIGTLAAMHILGEEELEA